MKKAPILLFILLLFSAVTVANSQSPVVAEMVIYIRADGSVEPSNVPIERDGNVYTLTGDIQASFFVEKDNLVIDGAGFVLQGTGANDYRSAIPTFDFDDLFYKSMNIPKYDETIIPDSNNTGIYSHAQNLTIMNLKITEFWCGIELEYSSGNQIIGNNVTGNNRGIWIHYSSNNALVDNNITSNSEGVSFTASHSTISGNTIADNSGFGIRLVWSFNNVSDNMITNNDRGIWFDGSCHNTLRNTVFSANTYSLYFSGHLLTDFLQNIDETNVVEGNPLYYLVNMKDLTVPSNAGWVVLVNCTCISVQDLTFTKKWQAAIWLVFTSESTVTRNNIKNSDQGICLIGSVNNSLSENTVTNSGDGIAVKDLSNDNVLSENTLADNTQGIYLRESSNSTLRSNTMTGNEKHLVVYCGDTVYPIGLSRFIHDVDTSNTVDGKPVYYWINEHEKTLPSDAGHVVLVNCTNIKAEQLTIAEGNRIHLAWTTNSCISENTVKGQGIMLRHSSSNLVSENDVWGIELYFSSNNTVTQNNVTNSRGIDLSASSHNNITDNTIIDNNYLGISLDYISTLGGVSDPDPNATVYEERDYESSHNIISGNNITKNNGNGISIRSSNNRIEDNSINENRVGVNVDGEHNTVVGNSITDNNQWGIRVYSSNSTVSNNYLSSNGNAINLYDVSNVTISGNIISNSTTGINLVESSDNCLTENTITDSTYGINLTRPLGVPGIRIVDEGSLYNNISANLVSNCTVGIQLDHSADNIFVQNNFIDNPTQVINLNSTYANTWDNGTQGNHWSSYAGTDTDGDGIGDTPYIIDENNQDNYPHMNPYKNSEDSNGDQKPSTLTLVALATVIGLAIIILVIKYRRIKST